MAARDDFPTLARIAAYSHARVSPLDLHVEAIDALRKIDELHKMAYLSIRKPNWWPW